MQRDATRRERVLQMYRSGELRFAKDFYHAAMILQHSDVPEHYLLAHELSVTAVFEHGEEDETWIDKAKWLAAASEDRFLRAIDRPQGFGTQYRSDDVEYRLEPMDAQVTDGLRSRWKVPSLNEARQREAQLTRESFSQLQQPTLRTRLMQLPINEPASIDELLRIVAEHGWPTADGVGFKAVNAAFDLLNNASDDEKSQLLPALRKAAAADSMTSIRVASIEDQLLIKQ
jgi:hypothetical protein